MEDDHAGFQRYRVDAGPAHGFILGGPAAGPQTPAFHSGRAFHRLPALLGGCCLDLGPFLPSSRQQHAAGPPGKDPAGPGRCGPELQLRVLQLVSRLSQRLCLPDPGTGGPRPPAAGQRVRPARALPPHPGGQRHRPAWRSSAVLQYPAAGAGQR